MASAPNSSRVGPGQRVRRGSGDEVPAPRSSAARPRAERLMLRYGLGTPPASLQVAPSGGVTVSANGIGATTSSSPLAPSSPSADTVVRPARSADRPEASVSFFAPSSLRPELMYPAPPLKSGRSVTSPMSPQLSKAKHSGPSEPENAK